ncbi:E3 ubiquitin-protein ligase [Sarracenia purpurea var. burkii]
MGLQGHVSDCSSESIPILVLVVVANWLSYLRSAVFMVLRSMGLRRIGPDEVDEGMLGAAGSQLAGLIVLAEQLNLNREFSFQYAGVCKDDEPPGSDCVVCLSKLKEGEKVRMLACSHVFHKECFDGWLDQLNFSCPLCRSPLVSGQRVSSTEGRVSHDVAGFFSL